MPRRMTLALVATAALLLAFAAVRAARTPSRQPQVSPEPPLALDGEREAARLARALAYPTVSFDAERPADLAVLAALHRYLAAAFPAVQAALAREVIGGGSLLYTWAGTDAALPPILLAGHLDVVPVEAASEGAWTRPPFAGVVADGFVWGRGALDDKGSVAAILAAVERLLAEGFAPARTVYLAFGHDEEIGGLAGAARIVERLAAAEVRLAFALDEGGVVVEGAVPGLARPLALINVAEKGSVSVELAVRGEAGHSSMPPRESVIGILARAVARVEERPFARRLTAPTAALFDTLGPEMPGLARLALTHRWLFQPLLLRLFGASPSGDAMLRTTTALTVFEAGVKDNVLPGAARAVVNFRTLPGDGGPEVLAHVRAAIDDPRVAVREIGAGGAAPPASPPDGPGYAAVARAGRAVFPDAVVAPGLLVGAADARHYARLTPEVYRFSATRVTAADLARYHGTDERIAVPAYLDMIRFYRRLLRDVAGGPSAGAASAGTAG